MIVGFTGRKGSGKDTAAAVFEAHGFVNLKMADAIKSMLATLLHFQGVDRGTIHRMLEGDLKEVPSEFLGNKTPRHAMQTLGTEWGRKLIDENIWVNSFKNAATRYENVVCSDVRFPNELAAVDVLYRIEREGTQDDAHESEKHIDTLPVDGQFVNAAPSAEEFQHHIHMMLFECGSTGSSTV